MSIIQRLTLIGMNNYAPDLFEKLVLPEGYDKQTFIDSLLLEHGEKCVLYSNPLFMRDSIGLWSNKWQHELERIYKALTEEYDPLHNYDRHEEYTDNENRTLDNVSGATHTATDKPNYTDVQTNDYKTVTDTNEDATIERLVSADNSGSYQPSSKDITNGGRTTDNNTGTITHNINGTTQQLDEVSGSRSNDNEQRELKHKAHLYGNIGTTKSTEMLVDEVTTRMQYNLYEAATRIFANELLIGIY